MKQIFLEPPNSQDILLLVDCLIHGHVCQHPPGHGAQLETHPREAHSYQDILLVPHPVNDGVLVRGEGVDAGLLHGHLRLHVREVLPYELLQKLLEMFSGDSIPCIWVSLSPVMKTDLG